MLCCNGMDVAFVLLLVNCIFYSIWFNRSVRAVCTLQMMQTKPFCQRQQGIFPPSVLTIVCIMRSTENQSKVSHLQAEHLTPLLLSLLFTLCTEPHLLPPLFQMKVQLHMEFHELVPSSQQNHSIGKV